LLLSGCATGRHEVVDADLFRFASMLIGEFSSSAQAQRDTSYFHIHLSMSRIWESRTDGVWLYVEQAMATRPDAPYRQRVYRLTRIGSDEFLSDIYTIRNAPAVIGAQTSAQKRAVLTYEQIELKNGCSVRMRRAGDEYVGGTDGTGCPSDLRGARYATSVITLTPGLLVSWDRGYDENGQQVWGATKGGYEFVKE
ncbi:MAG: chromophore lyase CpcT/CpeT, partial [Candidatus Kapaibacterium sp.]